MVKTIKELKQDFIRLQKDRKKIMVKTLNQLAYDTQQEAREQTKKEFTVRNNYATKSIIYKKANQKTLRSITGSTAPYQMYHEQGKTLKENLWGQSKDVNPIATIEARGSDFSKVIKSRYRFNRMDRIRDMRKGDKRIAGGKFFILSVRRQGFFRSYSEGILYERVGKGRKEIKAIRYLSKGKKVKKRPIFKNSAKKVQKSNSAYRSFRTSIVNNFKI